MWSELADKLVYDFAFVFREVFKLEGSLTGKIELEQFEIEFSEFLESLLVVVNCIHQRAQVYHLFPELELRGSAVCILQDTVGNPQVLGDPHIIVEVEGLPLSLEIIELPVLKRLDNPPFCDSVKEIHNKNYLYDIPSILSSAFFADVRI